MTKFALAGEIAKALGLPSTTTKAVLTLVAGELPTIELTMYATDSVGNFIVEQNGLADRLASVQFMIRLEPFDQ